MPMDLHIHVYCSWTEFSIIIIRNNLSFVYTAHDSHIQTPNLEMTMISTTFKSRLCCAAPQVKRSPTNYLRYLGYLDQVLLLCHPGSELRGEVLHHVGAGQPRDLLHGLKADIKVQSTVVEGKFYGLRKSSSKRTFIVMDVASFPGLCCLWLHE